MNFKPASDVSFYNFIRAFNQAYSDYYVDIVLNEQSMNALILRDAVEMSASVAAVSDGHIVGVAMLAIRDTVGWIGGVGVIPAKRGEGIGRAMMTYLLEQAEKRGIKRLYLEVIEQNQRAFKLYESLGFTITRRLTILSRKAQATTAEPCIQLDTMSSQEALALFETHHPVPNPWQRSVFALEHLSYGGHVWRTLSPDNPQNVDAFCMSQIGFDTINIIDIGLSPDHPDHQQLTFDFVSSIHAQMPDFDTAILNHPENHPGTPALYQLGYVETLAQHEMIYLFD